MEPATRYEIENIRSLDEKLAETVQNYIGRLKRGDCTPLQFRTALLALDEATRGVCDYKLTAWIEKNLALYPDVKDRDLGVYVNKKNSFVLVVRDNGDDKITIMSGNINGLREDVRDFCHEAGDTVLLAKKAFQKMEQSMCNTPFRRIA